MAWLIGYVDGFAVMCFLLGGTIANGHQSSYLEAILIAALWPITLPMALGAMLMGGD